jgi:hypothetical protein
MHKHEAEFKRDERKIPLVVLSTLFFNEFYKQL